MRYDISLIAPIVEVLHNCVKYLPLRVKSCTIHLQSQEQSQERSMLVHTLCLFFLRGEGSKNKEKNKEKNKNQDFVCSPILVSKERRG